MPRQAATYPKTYATIEGFWPKPPCPNLGYSNDTWMVVRCDDGRAMPLRCLWKCGGKSSLKVVVGARIKIYIRPGEDHPRYRLVGS